MEYLSSAIVYTYLFLHVGIILVVTSYYVLSASLAPGITERARVRFARRPWLPALIGLLVSVPWVVLALVLMNAQGAPGVPVKFLGAVLGCLWILCALIGGAAIAQHVGRPRTSADASWIHTLRGGLLLTLTWILPLVGWLIVLPLSLCTGVGCLILGLFPAPRVVAVVPAVPMAA